MVSYTRGTPVGTEERGAHLEKHEEEGDGEGEAGRELHDLEHRQIPLRTSAGASVFFFFTLVTGPSRSLSLKLSDTRVYEPQIRSPR